MAADVEFQEMHYPTKSFAILEAQIQPGTRTTRRLTDFEALKDCEMFGQVVK